VTATARRVDPAALVPWRARYLAELDAQCRFDSYHARGWVDAYLASVDGVDVGYGAVARGDEPALFEYFVDPAVRSRAVPLARAILEASGVAHFKCQTNDVLTYGVFRQLAELTRVDAILFAEHHETAMAVPGATVRERRGDDAIFDHHAEPVGPVVVEYGGEVVATAGALTHYNPPYADLFMEVRPDMRRRGFGALVLQGVKAGCYAAGLVPAARTGVDNLASQATLRRAGLRECGFVLEGRAAR
jgi:GNAT superfamily N-acetyltransferase